MGSENSENKESLNKEFQTVYKDTNLIGESLNAALEREEILKSILNNSHIVFILRKNEDRWPVEFVSENISNFGYTVEDFISGRVMYRDIIYPDDLNRIEKELEEKIRNKDNEFDFEYRILTKAGEVRWINERATIQRNEGGEITHFRGAILDITTRKKSEEKLEKAIERQKILNTVINNSQVVIFLWRNEKYWPAVFVSDNVIQFGYTVDDFVSKKVLYGKIIHPEDLKWVEQDLERSIQKGEVSFDSEYRIFTKAGDLRWINERTFIQREEDGRVTCFQGIILDITSRKQVEEALKRSLEMQKILRTIINKSPAVAFMWKNLENWPAEFVSENITQFGYTVEDFTSGKILYGNIIHKDDMKAIVDHLEHLLREGSDSFEMEYRIFTGGGDIRWVEGRAFIQRDSEGVVSYFQGIVIDVTERKEAQQMLEIQRELGVALSTTWNLQTMLNRVLDACLKIGEIDSCGIYLKDELLDQINLVAHRGLSQEFVKNISTYRGDSLEARQIWTEKPVYELDFFSEKMADLIRKEKITAVAVIPMKHSGEIIGSLNFASHTVDKIPQNVRNFLESVALQIVNFIAPIRIEADLV